MSSEYKHITVMPLASELGAEISGVNIAAGVGELQFAEIRRAYADYAVIFFREQFISEDQHIDFARRWSEININRFFTPVASHPCIAEVRKEPHQKVNIGARWHTDHSYDKRPAMGSILYAREVPRIGGDTLFASMYAAYESLSEGMQTTLRGLQAEHSSRHSFGAQAQVERNARGAGESFRNAEIATQDSTHPVVIRHPLSGRPALYVNAEFTVRFAGWTQAESQPLLDFLYSHATRNEFTCRFHWQKGSMAIWDNRATQHCALNDYHGELRLMHRITLEGDALTAAG